MNFYSPAHFESQIFFFIKSDTHENSSSRRVKRIYFAAVKHLFILTFCSHHSSCFLTILARVYFTYVKNKTLNSMIMKNRKKVFNLVKKSFTLFKGSLITKLSLSNLHSMTDAGTKIVA